MAGRGDRAGEVRVMTASKWVATGFGGPEVLALIETDVPEPGPGEVTIEVRAAGVNPADYKHFAAGQDPALLPLAVGFEVAGVVSALGPGTGLASGGGAAGDEVVASLVTGGYASALTVPAADVFARPAPLSFAQAANLLLVGTTAAEMLEVTGVRPGDTILVHGAAGAVGASVLQQARALGARVVGTAVEADFGLVRTFGAQPARRTRPAGGSGRRPGPASSRWPRRASSPCRSRARSRSARLRPRSPCSAVRTRPASSR